MSINRTFNRNIYLDKRVLGEKGACFIVAEIGINHNGDMDLAKAMITAAVKAGVDAVKFQNYKTEDFVLDKSITYDYEQNGVTISESQWAMFKRCELSEKQLVELKLFCDEKEVVFLSTPTSIDGLDILKDIGSCLVKNGSDFLTNPELISAMGASGLLTVLSTGMATVGEIDDAVCWFAEAGGEDLILLHCTSSYPTPDDEVNLNRIRVLSETFGCLSGFSDHSQGITAAIGARVLGACFIEKHFTTDKGLPGPDHRFSADAREMKELVNAVRSIDKMLGLPAIVPTPSEQNGRRQFRLSCVAADNIEAGTIINDEHILYGRPGTGIQPKNKWILLDRKLKKNISKGQPFHKDDI